MGEANQELWEHCEAQPAVILHQIQELEKQVHALDSDHEESSRMTEIDMIERAATQQAQEHAKPCQKLEGDELLQAIAAAAKGEPLCTSMDGATQALDRRAGEGHGRDPGRCG